MSKKFIVFCLVGFLAVSCKSKKDRPSDDSFNVPETVRNMGTLKISEEAMSEIIDNVSSPVEMAALVKEIGVPFSKKYLVSTEHVDHYNTSFKMAFNLGILGADLGYLNIYNKTGQAVEYLAAINKLADGLRVGQFFDFPTLKRLATNNENLDSLMYISVHSFNEMDEYLQESERSHLSALMITGVWLEGMYLTTQVIGEEYHPDLAERIGEQKINLNNLLLVLNNYRNDEDIRHLIDRLSGIKEEFNDIRITYEMGEPEAVEQDGMLMIIQNEKSIVEITNDQIERITQKTEKTRNELTSL